MPKALSDLIDENELQDFRMFLYELCQGERKYLLRNDILLDFEKFYKNLDEKGTSHEKTSIHRFLCQIPELIVSDGTVVLLHRYQMSRYKAYRISVQSEEMEEISIPELLDFREWYVNPHLSDSEEILKIDFKPFYDYGPTIKDVKRIGRGIEFLNRYMSSSLFQHPDKWNNELFGFLKIHSLDGRQLLIDGDYIKNYDQLVEKLETTISELNKYDPQTPHTEVVPMLRRNGFEVGWGDTVGRIQETMLLLMELFQAPDAQNLEKFISRIPMIYKIAIISPHGWFGQENVLGKPDTGGQVVYILDQVHALEKALAERIQSFGLEIEPKIIIVTRLIPNNEGTTSNVRLEKVNYTHNAYILRVPFKDTEGNVFPHWISRFKIWPYLEKFANECFKELQSEFNGQPDLIIGNYSDGNLVATLLSEKFGVTQCNIAHALEKTKYLFSDLYWFNFEKNYHFSLQFVADLISMNMADFIITSTYQEIAGSNDSGGQYESYQFFTMPGFMQVENGIHLFHPKFNVIPPGADERIYFPYHKKENRLVNQIERAENMLFHAQDDSTHGYLDNPEKPPIFTMARLDRIKNITGLVESFGQCPELQEKANLIVVAGKIDSAQTRDTEEIEEIERMYFLIKEYNLNGKIRWLGKHLSKEDSGSVYRIIADHKGIFVQPARFEGFGLTVIEAMSSGLPTFATQFGGPSEIIEEGKSGFLINPTVPELISAPVLNFFKKLEKEPAYWEMISEGGIKRVQEHFTWWMYSEKLLNLTALYGFWRYSVANVGKKELNLYCHLFFQLLFKPRAKEILNEE
jgi:sucrose synthase